MPESHLRHRRPVGNVLDSGLGLSDRLRYRPRPRPSRPARQHGIADPGRLALG
ncbi:hypothetical protein [Streptomyces fulvoviolaceus]|uniref:hypothetical protein n=1 Tax=Streptomyces fulvoviolaceus TaxID=285535 RepID=UPI000A47099E|nr:hypothetical protein [Streptomyces fulvoviolaceus]